MTLDMCFGSRAEHVGEGNLCFSEIKFRGENNSEREREKQQDRLIAKQQMVEEWPGHTVIQIGPGLRLAENPQWRFTPLTALQAKRTEAMGRCTHPAGHI